MSDDPYFPEPTDDDAAWGNDDEQPVEWLRRSSLPRAKSIRKALNENLRHFEPKVARGLAKKLRTDWKSNYFELIVGRWLQEIGARRIDYEPLGSNGSRIDYCAEFEDAEVCVEVVSKRMNQHAVPGRAYVDNSEQRVRLAFRDSRKRRQAHGARAAALLAIDGGIFGADVEEFDLALLGSTVQYIGFTMQTAGHGFNATSGAMLGDTASPWAGVLAFVAPSVFGATAPVLYVSPHFDGQLPFALLGTRRRMLGTREFEGSSDDPMSRIAFGEALS
jgi:hypothetical protein